MPHFTTIEERKAAIASSDGPEREQITQELRDYLQTAQLTVPQFASLLHVGPSTLDKFLRGTYYLVGRSDDRLRARLRKFFDSNPLKHPPPNSARFTRQRTSPL